MFMPILPGGDVANIEAYTQAILAGIDQTTTAVLGDFRATTRSWEHQPEFRQVPASGSGGEAMGAAGTDDTIYGYVARGTRAHGIDPSSASVLAFDAGKGAKTQPGVLGSHKSGKGSGSVFAQHVDNPGIKARGFEDAIAEKRQVDLERNVTAAILKASGG